MKRIILWFLSTVSAIVLLFGYHTSTSSQLATATGTSYSSRSTATTSTPSGGGSPGGAGNDPGGSAGTSRKSAAATAPKASTTASTVTGDVAQTQWGPVQVELTVAAGDVTDVAVLQQPSGNPRDEEINSYALPVLVQETLDAQSTRIDMVSGATVTSVGYLQSLQSALDRAKL